MNVEDVTIESDEHGWELHVLTTDEGRMVFNVHGVAEQLLSEVVTKIGPWLLEGYAVAREMGRTPFSDPDDTGYALDDPKHPTYAGRVADMADHLRKRERENG